MNNSAAQLRISINKYHKNLPITTALIAKTAATFFKDSFHKQGKLDGTLLPWKSRSFEFPGKQRAILMKRGTLVRSIQHSSNSKQARIISHLPYSAIQNDGGKIPITPRMRKFFWAMYYNEKNKLSLTKKGEVRKNKKNTGISQSAEIWRSLALTKQTHFDIPPRPFMYHSKNLTAKIDRLIDSLINKSF